MKEMTLALAVICCVVVIFASPFFDGNPTEIKEYEPTAIQILATLQEVQTQLNEFNGILQDGLEKAGTLRFLVEDSIQLIREEINDYNDAFDEDIGLNDEK